MRHVNGENKLIDAVNDGHLWVSTPCSWTSYLGVYCHVTHTSRPLQCDMLPFISLFVGEVELCHQLCL